MFNLRMVYRSVVMSVFVVSGLIFLGYTNYIMVHRPNIPDVSHGLVYEFVGKGNPVYISTIDLSVVVASLFSVSVSALLASNFGGKR